MKIVLVEEPGGPEQLRLIEMPKPEPGRDQALVKIAAAGVNYIDIYHRTGLYKVDPPITLGMEGAGAVSYTHLTLPTKA
jgi:NADPH2:quinone reductase